MTTEKPFTVYYTTPTGRTRSIDIHSDNIDAAIQSAVTETGCNFADIIDAIQEPRQLNGFPVTMIQRCGNVYTICAKRSDSSYVVATWWQELGTCWQWGHYFTGPDAETDSAKDFHATAKGHGQR